MQDRADEGTGAQQTAPGPSIGAYRSHRGVTHLLHASEGRLWDRDLITGRERAIPTAADELVLTPSNKVLVTLSGDELTRSALLRDGAVAPFREPTVRIPGVRRLLAARVTMTDVVEALVTTDNETLLVRLPGGRELTKWPFPATAAVGQDQSTIIGAPATLADADHEMDLRVVKGGVLSADAGAVSSGICIAGLTSNTLRASWETPAGFTTRVGSVSAQSVAVVRQFGPEEEPSFVVVDAAGDAQILTWDDLEPETIVHAELGRDVEAGVLRPVPDAAMTHSVFVSYAHEDDNPPVGTGPCCDPAAHAAHVATLVRSLGIDVFWDDQLSPGRSWAHQILDRFHMATVVLVLWGQGSVQRWNRDTMRLTMGLGPQGQAYEVMHCATKLMQGQSVLPLLLPRVGVETLPRFLNAQQALALAGPNADAELLSAIRGLVR
jgi:hypothetical protein